MTHRGILGAVGSSLTICAAPLVQGTAAAGSPDRAEGKPYDLLIKGGKVIDPSQGIEAELDSAVRNRKVASVAPGISEARAQEILRADGKIVTPGLIDLHAHVFPYVGPYGIEPDPFFLKRGVTTVMDAGTSGAFTFPAFRRFIIEGAATRIRALLHLVSIGMVAGSTPNMGELEDLRYCDPKLAVEVAGNNQFSQGLQFRRQHWNFETGSRGGCERAGVEGRYVYFHRLRWQVTPRTPQAAGRSDGEGRKGVSTRSMKARWFQPRIKSSLAGNVSLASRRAWRAEPKKT